MYTEKIEELKGQYQELAMEKQSLMANLQKVDTEIIRIEGKLILLHELGGMEANG